MMYGSSYKNRKKKVIIYANVWSPFLRGSVSTKSVRGNPGLATIQTKGVKVVIVTIMYTMTMTAK